MEATRMFRVDATQMFQAEEFAKASGPGGRKVLRWMFVADLFHRVILADQPPRIVSHVATDNGIGRYRKMLFGAVCGVCALLCLAFVVSWWNNRGLLADIDAVARKQTNRPGTASVQDLQALDDLRAQLVRLQSGLPWRFHWGLYTGNRILE
jgi:type VI protein secretion system component VasK